MKSLLALAAVSLLCSCASVPQMHVEYSGTPYRLGPTSADDPRVRSPRFYMDEGAELPAWARDAPRTNR